MQPKVGDDMTTAGRHRQGGCPCRLCLPIALMLGAYKFIFDGSPQGYTAWMKNPGYYDWRRVHG